MNNPTAGITAVILASGFSKRMGCNKLLLPVEGKAMIAHVFDAVRQVEFEQTVVVQCWQLEMAFRRWIMTALR